MIVIDASATGAILLQDEDSPPPDIAEALATNTLAAPAHWPAEVANLVLMAERRRRIAGSDRSFLFDQVRALRVTIRRSDEAYVWDRAVALAAQHRLTLYDAIYLELAIRLGGQLATLDGPLMDAARSCQITVLTWPAQ